MSDVRLIDANALRAEAEEQMRDDEGHKDAKLRSNHRWEYAYFIRMIDTAPTIDAQLVKHGKWVRDLSGELNCSYCGYAPKWDDDKFCANCGTRMDGGDADG